MHRMPAVITITPCLALDRDCIGSHMVPGAEVTGSKERGLTMTFINWSRCFHICLIAARLHADNCPRSDSVLRCHKFCSGPVPGDPSLLQTSADIFVECVVQIRASLKQGLLFWLPKWLSISVQVLFNGVESVMVLILNSEIASPVKAFLVAQRYPSAE